MLEFPVSPSGFVSRAEQKTRETLAAGRLLFSGRAPAPGARFILMYHRVLPRDARLPYPIQPGMFVARDTFERHLRCWRRWCDLVPLAGLLEPPRRASADRPLCAVTFDDGWRDTYSTALPLLMEYGVPATVFLPSAFVGTAKWFWPERLAFLLAASRENRRAGLAGRIDRRVEELKRKPAPERERLIGELEAGCRARGIELPREPLAMSWDQAREMADAGIEFGSHTANHVILTEAPPEVVDRELSESKRAVERQLRREVTLFCYPNGDYNPSVSAAVRKAGFRIAVTTRHAVLGADPDPFALPRIGLHEDISRTPSQLVWRIRRAARGTLRRNREQETAS